jgi:hypothetical protein
MAKELIQRANAILEELRSSGSKGRKNCRVGKACKATCINKGVACRVNFPRPLSSQIGKVADQVKTLNYQWSEAAVAAVLMGKKIKSKEDLVDYLKNSTLANADKYASNLVQGTKGDGKSIEEKKFMEYINHLEKSFSPFIGKVSRVSLAGSTRDTPSIRDLDEGLNKKQIKADVMFWIGGRPNGISVKAMDQATLVNYTVGEYDKKGSNLRTLRADALEEAGVPKNWRVLAGGDAGAKKSFRDKANAVFSDKSHPYWKELKKQITENETSFVKTLIEGYTGTGVRYPLYEVSDRRMKNLKEVREKLLDPSVKLGVRFYERGLKLKKDSKAASMPFMVTANGKDVFQGDIRTKGNWWAPPAVQMYNID